MVTNMISQLQWELPAQICGKFFWNFIHKMASRCQDDTVTGDFLRWAAKFSHRYFFRACRTFRKICRRLICCFKNEKKSCVLCRNFVLKVSLTILSAHDDKIRIPARPCNIFYIYIFFHQWLQSFFYLVWSICQLYRYSSCLLFMYVFIYQFTYLLFAYKLSTYRFTYYQNVL